MKTAIKKPISIVVYDYKDQYRMETFHYDCKKEKPKKLLRTYVFQTENWLNKKVSELRENYEVKDFYRNLLDDEEIDYTPHQQWNVFEWQPIELQTIISDYFRRTYDSEPEVLIKYDLYKGQFNVEFELYEGKLDEYQFDDFCDGLFDDFTYEDEKGEIPHMNFRKLFPRLLKEITGATLVMVHPKDQDNYGTWGEEDGAARFFFEK